MPIKPGKKETQDEFISRCIGEEINAGYEQDQAAAICYSKWEKESMATEDITDLVDDEETEVAQGFTSQHYLPQIVWSVISQQDIPKPMRRWLVPNQKRMTDNKGE
jgi:hypothetical protein